jgi:hypothetical protein
MHDSSNRYCARLHIPVPDLDVVAAQPETSLFQLIVAALLERGGPMTFDEIVARVERVTLPPRFARDDLRAGLKMAWHGRPPVVHDTGGRLALDLLFRDWWYVLARMEPERRRPRPSPPAFTQPPDDVPLSAEEVDAAFRDHGFGNCSPMRQAAAILEAAGHPLTLDEINARLADLSRHAYAIRQETVASWRRDLVLADASSAMRINPASQDIPAFRRAIRQMALARLRIEAENEWRTAAWEKSPEGAERRDRKHRDAEEARTARRALVHIARGTDGHLVGAAVVDAQARTIERLRVAGGPGLPALSAVEGKPGTYEELEAALASYDLLAGVDLRSSLRALGLDPERWWLAELRPVDRTHRPDERKSVPVTLDACIRATTGARRRLTNAAEWTRLADKGRPALNARIEDETRTLFAFYEYGRLHGGVRVRARPEDPCLLAVSWAIAGDPHLYRIVDAAERRWSPVDVVIGTPPDLADPWARSRRVDIVEAFWPRLIVREGDRVAEIGAHDIFAIRIVDPVAAESVEPGIGGHLDDRVCQITVTLDGIEPPIWRRVVVRASVTLERLHAILQAALGWTSSHLHVFELDRERIGIPYDLEYLDETYTRSSRIVHLGDVVDRGIRRFVYEYDFGDSWTHTIEIEEVDERNFHDLARCVDGARACPPEDCGGVEGYGRMLEILFDPTHEEFEEMRQWVGPDFQPERFDIREVNERLATVGWREEAI